MFDHRKGDDKVELFCHLELEDIGLDESYTGRRLEVREFDPGQFKLRVSGLQILQQIPPAATNIQDPALCPAGGDEFSNTLEQGKIGVGKPVFVNLVVVSGLVFFRQESCGIRKAVAARLAAMNLRFGMLINGKTRAGTNRARQ